MCEQIFVGRIAKVNVTDSEPPRPEKGRPQPAYVPYSVVSEVLEWCTGAGEQAPALAGVGESGQVKPTQVAGDSGDHKLPSPAQAFSKPELSRDERDRRPALTEARKRGLAPFDKHPLEAWEQKVLR